MMEPPVAEFTIIYIDNAKRAFWERRIFRAQIAAAKLYCETVLKCNPKSIVSIRTMSTNHYRAPVPATSDLQIILRALQNVCCQHDGETQFQAALGQACLEFPLSPENMKRRLLMFVGGFIDLGLGKALSCGKMLKDSGVALDVFNFNYMNLDMSLNKNTSILHAKYHYARPELGTLVTTADDNGSSQIKDIVNEYESSVIRTLSESTLKEHLHYLNQKAAADEKNKSVECVQNLRSRPADNECVQGQEKKKKR